MVIQLSVTPDESSEFGIPEFEWWVSREARTVEGAMCSFIEGPNQNILKTDLWHPCPDTDIHRDK